MGERWVSARARARARGRVLVKVKAKAKVRASRDRPQLRSWTQLCDNGETPADSMAVSGRRPLVSWRLREALLQEAQSES